MTSAAVPAKRFGWIKWVILVAGLGIGLPAGCTYWLFSTLADNEPARMATALAEAHPAVVAKLGSPLSRGRFATGSIKVADAGGNAELAIPVTGPKGTGTLHVKATKAAGRWNVDAAQVAPHDGSGPIDVIGVGIRS